MEQQLLGFLGKELIDSPFLSIMILDDTYKIVWHNEQFGQEMGNGADLRGKHCFEVTGSPSPHDNCPLMASILDKKRVQGFLDFGDNNFFFLTVPLSEGYAAKIHVFLPKEATNQKVIK